jgi:hypothetical protein
MGTLNNGLTISKQLVLTGSLALMNQEQARHHPYFTK